MMETNETEANPVIAYAIDALDYKSLLLVVDALYGNGTRIALAKQRTLARMLQLIVSNAQPLTERDINQKI
jgi:hypothetical protein